MLKVNLETFKVSALSNISKQKKSEELDHNRSQTIDAKYDLKNLQAYYLSGLDKVNFGGVDSSSSIQLGSAYNLQKDSVEFGVFSRNATRVQLEVFDKPVNGEVITSIPLEKKGNKWVTSISSNELKEKGVDIQKGDPVYYGYRAWGKNFEYSSNWTLGSDEGFISHVDKNGNRFNPNKLLTDPYAKEISHDSIDPDAGAVDASVYATGNNNFKRDSGKVGPKGIFVLSEKINTGEKPTRAIKDDIIYETHLRGLTMNDKSIPEEYRGTYKGAAMKAKYLKELGITMVEFLPVQEFDNNQNDHNGYNQNYWGYMTLGYFAPDRRYSSDKKPGGPTKEFKEMVKAFHDEGIKVAMDVVYNHTGEGGVADKNGDVVYMRSMMGLDNASYYVTNNSGKYYYDNSGCGANYNIVNPDAQKLVIDSLKYWSEEMGVDAFRHDLASILGNVQEKDGFYFDANSEKSYLVALPKELKARDKEGGEGIDFIAEPWAGVGEHTYQLGNFPKEWSEWNDNFKKAARKYLNQQERIPLSAIATALSGSRNVFYKDDYTRAINFITAHDGFTMKDMVSYNSKVNYGDYGSSDGGMDENISWDNKGSVKNQRKAVRNAMTMLMLSKGTPMIVGGDEILRTTLGNNNPWNQDKPFNWINWELDDKKSNMLEYTKGIINFRKSHPALRSADFYTPVDHNNNGLKSVTWLQSNAQEARYHYFDNPNNSYLGMRIDGTEYADSADSIYVAMNKGDGTINVDLPKNLPDKNWYLVANTSEFFEYKHNIMPEGKEIKLDKKTVVSGPRSMMLFIEK